MPARLDGTADLTIAVRSQRLDGKGVIYPSLPRPLREAESGVATKSGG